jgi:hypothetical protein
LIDPLVGRSLNEAFIKRRVGRFAIHSPALSASLVSRVWGIFAGTTAPYLKRFSLDKDLLLELKKEFTLRPMDRAMNTVRQKNLTAIDSEAAAA